MPLSSRLSAAAVLCLIFVGVAHPAFADEVSTCNPHQGTSGTSCIGQPCATLGMSEMDGDKASIIVCLQTSGSNSALVWKNQNSAAVQQRDNFFSLQRTHLHCPGADIMRLPRGRAKCSRERAISWGRNPQRCDIIRGDVRGFLYLQRNVT